MTSRKKDIAEHLMERMRLIGHVMNHAHGPPARGWQGDFGPVYDRAEALKVTGFYNSGSDLWYGRTRHAESAIQVWNVHPLGRLREAEGRLGQPTLITT